MPEAARKQRPYHHGNLRAALVEAGLRLLREHGPEAVTTRACAKIADVAPSAVFRHFADRRDLATAVATRGFELLGQNIARAGLGAEEASRMRAIGQTYLEFALDEPHLFRMMFRGDEIDLSNPELLAASQPLLSETSLASGGSSSISDKAILAWAVVHGLATLSLDSQLDDYLPVERERRRDALLRIVSLTAPIFR